MDVNISFYKRYLTGTIDREKVPVFERLMWRVTRGNLHFLTSEIQQTIYNPFTVCYFIIIFGMYSLN